MMAFRLGSVPSRRGTRPTARDAPDGLLPGEVLSEKSESLIGALPGAIPSASQARHASGETVQDLESKD